MGLGNPGQKYYYTRHNVGFRVIDKLASSLKIKLKKTGFYRCYLLGKGVRRGTTIYLVKPLTYMNNSGDILKRVLSSAKSTIDDLLVIYDNLDLPPGTCKLKLKGSSAGHKGLESIMNKAGTNNIMRLSIGIGKPLYKNQVVNYVLSEPEKQEMCLIEDAIKKAEQGVLLLIKQAPDKVMNVINKKY